MFHHVLVSLLLRRYISIIYKKSLRDGFPKVLSDHVQGTGNPEKNTKTINKETIMIVGLNVNKYATQQTVRCAMRSVSSSSVSAFQVLQVHNCP